MHLLEAVTAWRLKVLPLRVESDGYIVATTRAHMPRAMAELQPTVDEALFFVIAEQTPLEQALMESYPLSDDQRRVLQEAIRRDRSASPDRAD